MSPVWIAFLAGMFVGFFVAVTTMGILLISREHMSKRRAWARVKRWQNKTGEYAPREIGRDEIARMGK